MGKFVKVATKSDVPEGSGKVVEAEGKEIALFNASGNFHALENTCPHQGGPLGEGYLEGSVVTCPWHGWEFDVSSGVCQGNPNTTQPKFNVKVDGDDILVEV